MSSLLYDKHSSCSECRGHACDFDKQCNECKEWPTEFFETYVKHQKSLVSKSKKKESDKSDSTSKR